MTTTAAHAETVALQVLAWLAADEEFLGVFLGASGTSAEDLRARADDPDFLAAVLDFVLLDDAWVMACCDACGLAYDAPAAARQWLPGGAAVHWT